MNKEELTRKLNSVGKTAFTEYYDTFHAYSNGGMSKEDCIELLVSNKVSNDSGAAIRCSNAKLIFKANMQCEALTIIINSKRLALKTIKDAKKIMDSQCNK